jgi:hypothetical protein
METLEEFLASGQLGPIRPGASPAEIKKLLGEPCDVSVSRNPRVCKYGGLQLGFHREAGQTDATLTWLGVYFQGTDLGLPAQLDLKGWWPSSETTWTEFEEYLRRISLLDQATALASNGEYIELPSGVRVVSHEHKIHSIQYILREEVSTKQVSLSLPLTIWERVKKEASQQKVSPAKLCSDWIARKVQGELSA